MKKIVISAISLVVLTSSAMAATTEELLEENRALKAEIAALRSKSLNRVAKPDKHTRKLTPVASFPNIKGVSVVATVHTPIWQGFYAGLNAGYGFGTANNAQNYGWANPAPGWWESGLEMVSFATANSYSGRNVDQGGFIGGGQIGYNYQYAQSFVLGFEADIQGAGISGQGNVNGWAPYTNRKGYLADGTVQAGINWMGTARGRIGYLITPTVLAYASGGLAYGGTYLKTFPTTNAVGSYSGGAYAYPLPIWTQNSQQNLNVGWTAGAGAEWMMAPNWSIKGEAMFYDLGNTSVSNTAYYGYSGASAARYNPIGGSTTRAYYQGVIARAGLNYHFNFDTMPIVAKF